MASHNKIKTQFDVLIKQARKQAKETLLKPEDITSAIAKARGKSKRDSREKFLELLNEASAMEPEESGKL